MYDEIDSFAEFLTTERGYSANTVDAYMTDIVQLNDFLISEHDNTLYDISCSVSGEAVDVSSIGTRDLNSFVGYLFDCGLDFTSICRKISSMRSFFS
ncbi:MAG: site-specific integrase [Spirochaetota bacterium]